jgi:iron complex transport system ATP-binding protein
MAMIQVVQTVFAYNGQPVIRGISLDVAAGERIAILGPNGAGKTTLLKLLSGTRTPSEGSILLDGRSLCAVPRSELARRIAVVPQEFFVPFAFTAREVVELGRTPHVGLLRGLSSDDRHAVQQAMRLTRTIELGGRVFNELSGGERQRVIIAMALAQRPEALLLAEPTQQLDITRQAEILDLVTELNRTRGLTVVAAIHDLNLAGRYFDRLVVLNRGRVSADGTPESVLRADCLERAYEGPLEIVGTADGRIPIVLPAFRFRGRAKSH